MMTTDQRLSPAVDQFSESGHEDEAYRNRCRRPRTVIYVCDFTQQPAA
jgi:hypothetical protein